MLGYAVAAPNLRNYGFQTRQGLCDVFWLFELERVSVAERIYSPLGIKERLLAAPEELVLACATINGSLHLTK
jgi:hypothetical protein